MKIRWSLFTCVNRSRSNCVSCSSVYFDGVLLAPDHKRDSSWNDIITRLLCIYYLWYLAYLHDIGEHRWQLEDSKVNPFYVFITWVTRLNSTAFFAMARSRRLVNVWCNRCAVKYSPTHFLYSNIQTAIEKSWPASLFLFLFLCIPSERAFGYESIASSPHECSIDSYRTCQQSSMR